MLAVSNDCGNLIIGGSSRLLKRLVRHHITIPFLVRAVKTKPRARLYTRDVYASTEVSYNVRCLGVVTRKGIQPWLMEMMLDSHLHMA